MVEMNHILQRLSFLFQAYYSLSIWESLINLSVHLVQSQVLNMVIINQDYLTKGEEREVSFLDGATA